MAPSKRRLGEIAEHRGDLGAAIVHYRKFVDLWRWGDPEFRMQAEEVAGRIRMLGAGH